MLKGRGEIGEHRRQLGKIRLPGAERRRARAVEAGQAILDVRGVVGAPLLAVVDDVDAAVDLPLHHLDDRGGDGLIELGPLVARLCLFRQQQLDHPRRSRQAPGMGSEDPVGAAFHRAFFPLSLVGGQAALA